MKFSKYLPEFGYDPIIITVDPEKAEYPIKDHTLEQDVRAGQIVYRTDCSGIYEYYKKLTKAQSAPYSGFVNEGTPSLKQKIARFIRGNFSYRMPEEAGINTLTAKQSKLFKKKK